MLALTAQGMHSIVTKEISNEIHVTKRRESKKNMASVQKVHRLLHFVELLEQARMVKVESVFLFPQLLRVATKRRKAGISLTDVTGIGESVVRHVSTMDNMLLNLGALRGMDIGQAARGTSVGDAALQAANLEELAANVLSECRQLLGGGWEAKSELKAWLEERLVTLGEETQHNIEIFQKFHQKIQPEYGEAALERAGFSALP